MKRRSILTALAALPLLCGLQACQSTPVLSAPPDAKAVVDFGAIHRLSELYRVMRYESDARIRDVAGAQYDELALVDLPGTKNRYMVGTLHDEKRQEVFIRGTANMRNALYDMEYRAHRSVELGIDLHAGFEAMTFVVYHDILPRLRPDYDIVLFGHSLGAAEAVILSMLLDRDHFRVRAVYASGQPRITDAEGEKKFDYLPIVRIINEDDPVPFLPPRAIASSARPYTHIGSAIILLDGPYYALVAEDTGNEALATDFWRNLPREGFVEQVDEHFIAAYLARLAPKVGAAIQVPYAERGRYVKQGS